MGDGFRLRGLLLGAAAAATQVEGGDKGNSWYDWYRRGAIKDGSDPSVATMHWERWEEDARLMADMGLGCCRLGLEWSRLEPQRGVFDNEAVDHYRRELTLLRELGIKPMVTLWHFSNPMWFELDGGFLAPGALSDFMTYVEFAARSLGDLAECWITLNEPNVYALNGYVTGDWPPGERSLSSALEVLRVMARCHIESYALLHRLCPGTRVGFANHLREFAPKDAKNPAHIAASAAAEYLFQTAQTRAFMRGRGALLFPGLPRGEYYDFIGINYYTRSTVSGLADGVREGAPVNDLGWEIRPEGLAKLCRRLRHEYSAAPIFITENGICDNADVYRCRYIYDHLKAVCECGVPVERYYHWCFCDNFEWLEGGSARFGLVHVDYETQRREVKRAGRFYSEIIKNNGVTQEMYDEYVAPQAYRIR